MSAHIRSLEGRLFLCEPAALERAVRRAFAAPRCPTMRELVQTRAEQMALGAQAAAYGVRAVKGKIGLLPIIGPIDQRFGAEIEKTGGTALEWVHTVFDALLADSTIGAIVLEVDSPGGGVYGVEELADKIYRARDVKPIYAIANSQACSAAYWIASAAGHLAVTPSGDVGSIGVYCVHVDESKQMEQLGLRVTCVQAGEHKTDGAPWAPLSDGARERLQAGVDALYERFVSAVARYRGVTPATVRESFGRGAMVAAPEALAAGMVDRITPLHELLAKLTGRGQGPGGQSSRADVSMLRRRIEHARQKTAQLTGQLR